MDIYPANGKAVIGKLIITNSYLELNETNIRVSQTYYVKLENNTIKSNIDNILNIQESYIYIYNNTFHTYIQEPIKKIMNTIYIDYGLTPIKLYYEDI